MPDYGIESKYTTSDSELFTEIDGQLKEAQKRSTYQPYFEMFQTGATRDYFDKMQSAGFTGQGKASGFAGSTQEGSFMQAIQQGFGEKMVKVEEDITKKQSKATQTINDIIQNNRQTALSLKQIEEGNKSSGGGCFAKGSLVLMADGTEKDISKVKKGDKVVGYTGEINTVRKLQVNTLGENDDLYGFANGEWFTASHPFLTIEGWKSLAPQVTKRENTSFSNISKLQVGDKIFLGSKLGDKMGYIHMQLNVISTKKRSKIPQNTKLYNILVDGNHTYHVNSIVVHSVQPAYDEKYVKDGLKNLSKQDKKILFKAVVNGGGEKVLNVLGNAFGISTIDAFRNEMERMNGR